MALSLELLSAFGSELQKVAEAPRPGDIIVMSPLRAQANAGRVGRATDVVWNAVSPRLQGGLTHAAIVVGNGDVVESRAGEGITRKSFEEAVRDKQYVVKRPAFSERTRQRAVSFAEKQVGKQYSWSDVAMQAIGLLLPTSVTKAIDEKLELPREREGFNCASLVTAAYGRAHLAAVRGRSAAPADLRYSPKLKDVLDTTSDSRTPVLGRLSRG